MITHSELVEKVCNTPLLAHPDKAATVAAVILRRAGVQVNAVAIAEGGVNRPRPARDAAMGPLQERQMQRDAPLRPFLFGDGIAVIEVTGSLAHRQWVIGQSSGITGYDGIGAQLDAALDDREVRGILFDIHSPGGEAHGCFQLADRIAQARGVKPIVAIADEMAFSAAYAIAAACSEVWLASDTAECGSVGACMVHLSYERWLKGEGIKPTIFQSGARKTEGHMLADLDRETVTRFQAKINELGAKFVRRVAAWRKLSRNAVAAMEAACFTGDDAVRIGLADGIATPEEVFQAIVAMTGGAVTAGR